MVLLVKYAAATIQEVLFVRIEHLAWDCLTIGALGWGQIQIANASRIVVDLSLTKRDWMLQLCDVMLAFYPHEIEKITDRISYFGKVRQFWTERV